MLARFQVKVDTTPGLGPEGECHEWTASTNPAGYGWFRLNGKMEFAHRVAWFIATGTWPGDKKVLHHCDNPPCVRFDHLFLGTQAQNSADMALKGRAARQRGERHGRSRLTEADVRAIRQATGLQREIAARYGIVQSHVSQIKLGKRWTA